LSVETGEGSND